MATNLETILIGVGIDASQAKKGAAEWRKATRDIKRDSENLEKTQEKAGKSSVVSFGRMGGALFGVAAAYKAVDFVIQGAKLAARFETLGVVMETVGRNAGYNAEQLDFLSNSVRENGITLLQSRETIVKMVQAQLDLTRASELARVAQDAAVIGNVNSSEALARLIHGIQSAQVEVLRTIGLNVSFERSYRELATRLDRTVDSLTETEKAAARLQEVLDAGEIISGAYANAMNTAGKQVTSLARHVEDAKVKLGGFLDQPFQIAVHEATELLKGFNDILDSIARADSRSDDLVGTTGELVALTKVLTNFYDVLESRPEGMSRIQSLLVAFRKEVEETADVLGEVIIPVQIQDKTLSNGLPAFAEISHFAGNSKEELERLNSIRREQQALVAEIFGTHQKELQIVNDIDAAAGRQLNTFSTQLKAAESLNNQLLVENEIRSGSLSLLGEALEMTQREADAQTAATRAQIERLRADQQAVGLNTDAGKAIESRIILLQQEIQRVQALAGASDDAEARYQELLEAARQLDALDIKKAVDPMIEFNAQLAAGQELLAGRHINDEEFNHFLKELEDRAFNAKESIVALSAAQRAHFQLLDARLTTREANLDASSPLRSQVSIENERDAILQRRVEDLNAEANAILQNVQEGGPTTGQLTRLADIRTQVTDLRAQMDQLARDIDTNMVDSVAGFFDEWLMGTESAGDAFQNMLARMASDLASFANQELARNLFQNLFPSGGPGGFLAGLFGAKKGGGGSGGIISPQFNSGILDAGNFATGGSFMVGGPGGIDSQLVAFRATPGERVTVNTPQQSEGPKMNFTINLTAPGGFESRETQQQAASKIASMVEMASRRM